MTASGNRVHGRVGGVHGRVGGVHGWVVVDKPEGLSSAQVVHRVKRALGAKKAGHGGTLDPFATGVLPIALGEATKVASYALEGHKAYACTVRWGVSTATQDGTGAVVGTSPARPSAEALGEALGLFMGRVMQTPPRYAAVKVAGQRAYAKARRGERVDLAPRSVEVMRLTLEGQDREHAWLHLECSKGFYVRSLVRDLALHLGCEGHLAALRRLQAGPFGLQEACGLDGCTQAHIQPLEAALGQLPRLNVLPAAAQSLKLGQGVTVMAGTLPEAWTDKTPSPTIVLALCAGVPVGLASLGQGVLHPVRNFVF